MHKLDANIFIVDHNHDYTTSLKKSIDNPERYLIETFTSGEKFLAHLSEMKFRKNDICIVFLGYQYFDEGNNTLMNGIEILEATKVINKEIEVVMLTGEDEGSYGSYVMKGGAHSFIPKNQNIHLRINNIVMGIISQKRLIQKRNSFMLSLKLLIAFAILFFVTWFLYNLSYFIN